MHWYLVVTRKIRGRNSPSILGPKMGGTWYIQNPSYPVVSCQSRPLRGRSCTKVGHVAGQCNASHPKGKCDYCRPFSSHVAVKKIYDTYIPSSYAVVDLYRWCSLLLFEECEIYHRLPAAKFLATRPVFLPFLYRQNRHLISFLAAQNEWCIWINRDNVINKELAASPYI